MRHLGAIACLVILAAFACGKPADGVTTSNGYKVYEATSPSGGSPQLAVIDSTSHSVERSLPLGALSPDGVHLYTVQATTLLDIDPHSGAVARTLALPGSFHLPQMTHAGLLGGLSQNGSWLVLESSPTHTLVISTTDWKVSRRVDLTGDFRYDAVSNDGQRLYLIQYLNGRDYNVRLFDLVGGMLDANIVVDKADGNQAMTGLRLGGVYQPDGSWLYSMYVRENGAPFIHALSLDGPFAFCLDLPGSGVDLHWSLAMSRDGSRLYAANGALGIVADVEPATNYQPAIKRVAQFDRAGQPKQSGGNGAALVLDGRTLIVSTDQGIAWLDTGTLQVHERALRDWKVWSLALSSDGSELYAVNDAGTIAQIATSSTTTFAGAPGRPIALLTVS